jgi:hypothetical protein
MHLRGNINFYILRLLFTIINYIYFFDNAIIKIMKNNIIRVKKYLKIIDKIEKVRSKNNVNWMDVLRLSLKNAPDQTIKLIKSINRQDERISQLFRSIKNL